MKILDRLVIKRCVYYFFIVLLVLLSFFFVIDLVSRLWLLSKAGFLKSVIFVLYRMPLYTVRFFPAAVLLSVISVFGELSANSELTAIKSLGISIYRLLVPVVIFSGAVCVVSFAIEEMVVPKASARYKALEWKIKGKPKAFVMGSDVWVRTKEGFFNAEFRNKDVGERAVFIRLSKAFEPIERINAYRVKFVGKNRWKLLNVYVWNLKRASFKHLREKEITLPLTPSDISKRKLIPELMSVLELFKVIEHLKRIGYNVNPYLVELYSKLFIPFTNVIAALLGVSFGVFNPRKVKRGYSIAVAAALTVLMWMSVAFFANLGKSGVLPPIYAASAPELIFLALSLILVARLPT